MSLDVRMCQLRAQLGGLTQSREPDDPELLAARQRLAEYKRTRAAERVFDAYNLDAAARQMLRTMLEDHAGATS